MNETLSPSLALATGFLLGVLFFRGLWWTIQKGVSSKWPAVWFVGSLLLRMSIVLAGFYFVSGGNRACLPACLVGFIIARMIVMRLTQAKGKTPFFNTGDQPCASVPMK